VHDLSVVAFLSDALSPLFLSPLLMEPVVTLINYVLSEVSNVDGPLPQLVGVLCVYKPRPCACPGLCMCLGVCAGIWACVCVYVTVYVGLSPCRCV
jgi:hypothetical protein